MALRLSGVWLVVVDRGLDPHPFLPSFAYTALAPWLRPPAREHPWPAQVPRAALSRFNAARGEVVDLTLVEPIVVEVSADVGWDGQSFRHLLRFVRARPELHPMEVSPPSRTT
ncbi:hypothetical protein ACFT2C_04255 [Promicromonospora sp. NPDC057138]|uniref:hypothetical protein n=1 Tax=Promicromonospora sp. NPDC057138 TaxID=3346031 RepID=UPI0036372002